MGSTRYILEEAADGEGARCGDEQRQLADAAMRISPAEEILKTSSPTQQPPTLHNKTSGQPGTGAEDEADVHIPTETSTPGKNTYNTVVSQTPLEEVKEEGSEGDLGR